MLFRSGLDPESYRGGQKIVGLLMDGTFTSLFRNRFRPDGTGAAPMKETGVGRTVVISDGDFLLNGVDPRSGKVLPLGFDGMTGQTFANEEVILNLASWLTDDSGLINARTKKVLLRPLDKDKVRDERLYWQLFNLALPVVIMVLLGVTLAWVRRKRYSGFNNG